MWTDNIILLINKLKKYKKKMKKNEDSPVSSTKTVIFLGFKLFLHYFDVVSDYRLLILIYQLA